MSTSRPPAELTDILTHLREEFGDETAQCRPSVVGVIIPNDQQSSAICKPISDSSIALYDPLSSSDPRIFNFTHICFPDEFISTIQPSLAESLEYPSSIFFFIGPSHTYLFHQDFFSSLLSPFHNQSFFASISTVIDGLFYSLDGSPGPSPWLPLEELSPSLHESLSQHTDKHVYCHLKNSSTQILFIVLVSPESLRSLSSTPSTSSWIAHDQLEFNRLLHSSVSGDWISGGSKNQLFSTIASYLSRSKLYFSFFIPTAGNDFSDALHLLKTSSVASRVSSIVVPKSELGSPSPMTSTMQSNMTGSVASMSVSIDDDKNCTISFCESPQVDDVVDDDQSYLIEDELIDVPLSRFCEPASEEVLLARLEKAVNLISNQESMINELQTTSEETFLTLSTALEDAKRRNLDLEERFRIIIRQNQLEDVVDYYERVLSDVNGRLDKFLGGNKPKKSSKPDQLAQIIDDLKSERSVLLQELKSLRVKEAKNQGFLLKSQLKECRKNLVNEKKNHCETKAKLDGTCKQLVEVKSQLSDQLNKAMKESVSTKSRLKTLGMELLHAESEGAETEVAKKIAMVVNHRVGSQSAKPRRSASVPKKRSSEDRIGPTSPKTKQSNSTFDQRLDNSFVKSKLSHRRSEAVIDDCLSYVTTLDHSEGRRVLAKIQDFIFERLADYL
ncbi:hypothetical protein GEMRC1_012549 [Eukaryota sp. GEM-RC1]